jgi:hypothetical protein
MDDPTGMWARLPSYIQDRIDAELRHRRLIAAIMVLRDQAGLDPKPSLYAAQDIVAGRMDHLTRLGVVEPEPSTAVADMLVKARAISAAVAAVEAVWDGDTQGWFVELLAIVKRPGSRHERFDEVPLAALRHGPDIRLFNGQVPPWPEATEATEKGRALAGALGVPFYFASPVEPND